MMIADNERKWYSIHRQWGSPYLIVWCGNLTIQENERYFHCFLFKDKIKLRHSPAGHRAAILFNWTSYIITATVEANGSLKIEYSSLPAPVAGADDAFKTAMTK